MTGTTPSTGLTSHEVPAVVADARSEPAPVIRWAVAAGVLGLVVSLAGSSIPSLWTDEAATVSAAGRTLAQLRAMATNIDAVHATYYAFMHGWLSVFPAQAFWLRLPSALAVGLAAAGVLVIARRLAGLRTALLATAVFVVLPRTTWMGVEARPYAFSALLAVAATVVALQLVPPVAVRARTTTVRWPWLVAYAVVVGLGIAVHVYVALLLVAHGISLLLDSRVSWRLRWAWLGAGLVGVALASPVVWTAVHQTGQLGGGAFGPVVWIRNVVVNQWFLGETPTLSTGADSGFEISLASSWKLASVLLALLGWGLIGFGLLVRNRQRALLRWALPWVVVPTLVIGLYSLLVHNTYNPRYFSFAAPGLALLLGHGLALLPRRRVLPVLLGLVVVLSAPVYVSQRQVYAKSSADWSRVAGFVAEHGEAGDGVYFSPRYEITGSTVTQTARGIRTAYPQAFAGMTDVTLLRSAVADDNLSGTSVVLTDATSRLSGLGSVWVIRRLDYRYAGQDDQTLAAAGFRPGRRWTGPLDTVVEFDRVP